MSAIKAAPTPPGWERGEFDYQTAAGIVRAAGFVRPPFGVAVCKISRRRHWAITHLPTGGALYNVAGIHPTPAAAAEVADFLRLQTNAWEELTVESDPEFRLALAARIRAAVVDRFPNAFVVKAPPRAANLNPDRLNGYGPGHV